MNAVLATAFDECFATMVPAEVELALFCLDIHLSKDARGWMLPRCRDERPRSGVMGLSGAPAAGPLAPGQRWSVARKRAVVLRLTQLGQSAPARFCQAVDFPMR